MLRIPFVYDPDEVSRQCGLDCGDKMMTVQDEKDECDINVIVKRFGLTGELPPVKVAPQYGDFTGIDDYQTALNRVLEADRAFGELPAEVRREFNNDAGKFLAFCYDPKNADKLAEWNLLSPEAMDRRALEAQAMADAAKIGVPGPADPVK